jgi:hypothetical protein
MALTVLISSGVALALNTIQCKTDTPRDLNDTCYGTAKRDLMKGTDGPNDMYGKGAADVLKGFRHTDWLFGQGGNDRLLGGPAVDVLFGQHGDDTLEGGDGSDSYGHFDRWGNDVIVDTAVTPDNDVLSGNWLDIDEPSSDDSITVNLNSDSGPVPEVSNGTDTIDWSSNVIDNLRMNSRTDDRISASSVANYLRSYAGSDTVLAQEGDDYIDVRDGDPDDTVDCGEGTDTVRFDEGDELVVPDACESKNPPF